MVNVHAAPFLAYDMEGPVQPDITWLPISWDEAAGQGSYLMRMQPGAVTIEHEHGGFEEFLVLEGRSPTATARSSARETSSAIAAAPTTPGPTTAA